MNKIFTPFALNKVPEKNDRNIADVVWGDFDWVCLRADLTKLEVKSFNEMLSHFKYLPTLNTHRHAYIGLDSLRDKMITRGLIKESKVRGKYLIPRDGLEVQRVELID